MKTILFQGDSITDCIRDKEDTNEFGIITSPTMMGRGYAYMIATALGAEEPKQYRFLNRGINGNRVTDLLARVKKDIINLQPDYLSIMIGVNDVWHEIAENNGVDPELYEKTYCLLLDEIYKALPDIKIILMSPFVIQGRDTVPTEERPDRWELFRTGVDKRIEIVNRIGEKYDLPVIPMQKIFDEAIEKSGDCATWALDGVHPSPFGHKIMADAWIKQFKAL